MANDNPAKPFYSVLVLAFVCSAMVAAAAVGLRPLQEENKQLDQKKHILYAAGLFDAAKTVDEMFIGIQTRIVDLASGEFVSEEKIPPEQYQQVKAAFTEKMSRPLSNEEDIARIRRLENYSLVYLVKKNGELQQIILPVRGKGLWSTMYAYVAVAADGSTIKGVSFYEHGETPGLGGEIENKNWRSKWVDKEIYGDSDSPEKVALRFAKGTATATGDEATHVIDGLSGATLTTRGVDNLMAFWFGEHGFQPFIQKLATKTQKENANG